MVPEGQPPPDGTSDAHGPDLLYTVKEVAEVFFQGKVSVRQVNDLFHEGEIEGFRVGAKILIALRSLNAYRARQTNRPKVSPPAQPQTAEQAQPPPAHPKRRRKGKGEDKGFQIFHLPKG